MSRMSSMSTQTADRPLAGRVAIVTGASRGGGRGIALELGAAGATVYVTGRSRPGAPPPEYAAALPSFGLAELPGTIDETAAEVTRAGGEGIAVQVDHRNADEVAALVARVERDHGRLDLLVNNAWGGHHSPLAAGPFWEQSLAHWDDMFQGGVRNHVVMSRAAAPLMIRRGRGLIVTTTFWDRDRYMGVFFYDLAKAAMTRAAFGMAQDLRPHGVASIALSPGWMRTELVVGHMGADAERWQEVPRLARTESPRYVGRAVVALAADPAIMAKTGGVYRVGDLAREYGFTDVDGRVVEAFEING